MISCRRHSIKWLSYRGHLKEKQTKICPLVALRFCCFLIKLVLKTEKERPDNDLTTVYWQTPHLCYLSKTAKATKARVLTAEALQNSLELTMKSGTKLLSKFKQNNGNSHLIEWNMKNNRSKGINNTGNTKGARIDKPEEWNGSKLWFSKTC